MCRANRFCFASKKARASPLPAAERAVARASSPYRFSRNERNQLTHRAFSTHCSFGFSEELTTERTVTTKPTGGPLHPAGTTSAAEFAALSLAAIPASAVERIGIPHCRIRYVTLYTRRSAVALHW